LEEKISMAISIVSNTSTQEELNHAVGPDGKVAPTIEEQEKWGKTETEVPGAPPKEEAETVSESETEPQEAEGKSEPEATPLPKGIQRKIDKEVKRRKEEQEKHRATTDELSRLRNEVAELKKNSASAAKPIAKADIEPKIEDFPSHDDWLVARTEWRIQQNNLAKEAKKAEEAEQERIREIYDSHNSRLADAKNRYEDFEEVITNTTTPWKDKNPGDKKSFRAFEMAIFKSENGPDVLYHLATHPDEFAKFEGKDEIDTNFLVRDISRSLLPSETPKAVEKPKSKLNPPIKPVGGGGTSISAQDLAAVAETGNQADYRRARNGRAGRFD
jgi:DNA repair exonuclease SbcCD ATPase subunit